MPTKDLEDYRRFTKPAELHKAVNTLRGLVAGINSDMDVSSKEVTELVHWCEIHAEFRDRHPFSEILPVVERATEDGVVTEEEAKDILWLCNNFADNNAYYDMVTSSIQFLAGMLHGLLADGELSDREIMTLKAWSARVSARIDMRGALFKGPPSLGIPAVRTKACHPHPLSPANRP